MRRYLAGRVDLTKFSTGSGLEEEEYESEEDGYYAGIGSAISVANSMTPRVIPQSLEKPSDLRAMVEQMQALKQRVLFPVQLGDKDLRYHLPLPHLAVGNNDRAGSRIDELSRGFGFRFWRQPL